MLLLNKVLSDGNTLYRQGRLAEAETRYRYGLRKVRESLIRVLIKYEYMYVLLLIKKPL